MRILLVPLTRLGVEMEEASRVLQDCFDIELVVYPYIYQPPLTLYSWDRMQYRSDYIVEWIGKSIPRVDSLIVGIGDIDAYVPGMNFVLGQADPRTGTAAVYLRRLKLDVPDYSTYLDRIGKEVLHEVGHLLGLGHCGGNCVMRFSNTVREVDYKPKAFCAKCSRRLLSMGVKVKCVSRP